MLPTLYNIRVEHLALLQHIEDCEGELTPEIENQLALTKEQFEEKAVSYAGIIKTFEADEKIIDEEIKRLQKLKERKVKGNELFKQRLSEAMQQFDVPKIDTPTLKLSFRKSEAVEISDESLIPEDLKELVPASYKVSKTKIKEAIKEGVNVPGATLLTKQNLQIK